MNTLTHTNRSFPQDRAAGSGEGHRDTPAAPRGSRGTRCVRAAVLGERGRRGRRPPSKRVHKAPEPPLSPGPAQEERLPEEKAAGARRPAAGGRARGQRKGRRGGLGRGGSAPRPPRPTARAAAPSRVRARPHRQSARRASRGARVEGHGALTMELSEYVQKGFQMLADPGCFDSGAFTRLVRSAFQSLLDAQADEAVLGKRLGPAPGRPGRSEGAASPGERGEAPGRGSPRPCPSLRTECGFAALPGRTAAPEHCSVPAWHLHGAGDTRLA
jgi:hypothetical protein